MSKVSAQVTTHFGYIEGYYGRLLSWDQRAFLLDHLHAEKLNTYVYAPKEDPYHRRLWKKPYPREWRTHMTRCMRQAAELKIRFVPCVAPGLSFDYRSSADYRLLLAKLRMFLDLGADTVAILMDDIPETLDEKHRKHFRSLGHAHGLLLDNVLSDIRSGSPGAQLWFCPTVYTDEFSRTRINNNQYLVDLAKYKPAEIPVFWTGPHVVSQTLSRSTLHVVSRLFNKNCILWDNLYANDYCPMKLFVGPYSGRDRSIRLCTGGLLLNPTGLPRTDAFLLSLLAGYVRGMTPARGWSRAAVINKTPPEFSAVKRLFSSPFWRPDRSFFTARTIRRATGALHYLAFEWKSPLQLEWFPFLHQTEFDISLAMRDEQGASAAWIAKRYPPFQAYALTRQ